MRLTLTMIIAALACAISATARSAEEPRGKEVVPVERFVPFLSMYYQFLLSPTRQDCKNPPVVLLLPTCVIDVDVWLINSGGTDYCLTQFPREVTFDRLTRVVWKLKQHNVTSSTTGRTYNIEFHSDYGILPLLDMHRQVVGGGFGDGASANKWWYHRINLHSSIDPTIIYAPMILQVLSTDSNDIGVCAVGDPRMVNE